MDTTGGLCGIQSLQESAAQRRSVGLAASPPAKRHDKLIASHGPLRQWSSAVRYDPAGLSFRSHFSAAAHVLLSAADSIRAALRCIALLCFALLCRRMRTSSRPE
jgi:hypothetical protein